MSGALEDDACLQKALTGGALQLIGEYRFYFEDERWEWSAEVQQLHGYEPGTVTPTTELVLSHKHPEDYSQVAATLNDIRRTHEPFSTRHRIVTTQGATRDVVVMGERIYDDTGDVVGTQGFYIDVTPTAQQLRSSLTEAVAEFAQHRAVIEQAKGILMYVYHVTAEVAFDLLIWRSQETNMKVRTLAEQVLIDIASFKYEQDPQKSRETFDQLFLTADIRASELDRRNP
ncbi:MAG: PAS and ANTAR domain-containing protein [Mycobacterium sp.]